MKRNWYRENGAAGIEIIEEAFHLLKSAPASTLVTYHAGAVPFVLGFLFFWADMSHSAFASGHLASASLGLSLLFLWMKAWQSIFAFRLLAQLQHVDPPALNVGLFTRIFVRQTVIQPSGLIVLPIAALVMLPLGWVHAFYQNVTLAVADHDLRTACGRAAANARLWPGQNHVVLLMTGGFAVFVFLNCVTVSLAVPQLAEMFLGIETRFSRDTLVMLNSTFFSATLGLTYLCVDPLLKACHVLRCFHGDSLRSGADIRSRLRRRTSASVAGLVVLLMGLVLAGEAGAQEGTSEVARVESPEAVSATELDRTIDDVIRQSKYAWRLPRETLTDPEGGEGFLAGFLKGGVEMLRDAVRSFFDWLERALRGKGPTVGGGASWAGLSRGLLAVLILLVGVGLGFLVLHLVKNRRPKANAIPVASVDVVPDLEDESVSADRLPDDEWSRLGREFVERGEFRLALRAFYLASLAFLAERGLLSIARFKSNCDYERELGRRAHALPGLLPRFGENVVVLDRVWYGNHVADEQLVERFVANVEEIRNI